MLGFARHGSPYHGISETQLLRSYPGRDPETTIPHRNLRTDLRYDLNSQGNRPECGDVVPDRLYWRKSILWNKFRMLLSCR